MRDDWQGVIKNEREQKQGPEVAENDAPKRDIDRFRLTSEPSISPLRRPRRETTPSRRTNNQERKKEPTHRQQAVLRVLVLGDARVDPSLPGHRVGRH